MNRLILLLLVLFTVAALPAVAQTTVRVGVDQETAASWDALGTAFSRAFPSSVQFSSYAQASIPQQIVLQSFAQRDPIHFFMVPRAWTAVLSRYLIDISELQQALTARGVDLVEVNRTPIGVSIPFAPDWFLGVTSWPSDRSLALEFLSFVSRSPDEAATSPPSSSTTSAPTSAAQFATQKVAREDHNTRMDGALTALIGAAQSAMASVSSQAVTALPFAARSALESLAKSYGIPFSSSASTVTVVIEAQPGRSASTVAALGRLGVPTSGLQEASGRIKVTVPLASLDSLAQQLTGVSFIRPPYTPFPLGTPTEGVGLIGADAFHAAGLRGAGTKIAVIDLGFSGLSQAQMRGDLPYSVVQRDLTGTGLTAGITHGTAVAEIIHDIAPEAQLYLIKIGDDVDLDQAVTYCLSQGIHVINHSLGWYNTNFYDGTGTIAEIASRAIQGSILWVNAAGNEAERHWKGSFSDINSDGWLDQSITFHASAGSSVVIFLTWNEWPQASTDYDLYLYGPGDTLIASSTKYQTGTEEPTESIQVSTTLSGIHSIRIRGTGARTLELFNLYQPLTPAIADSSILAPGNVASVVTVGALGQAQYTTGPIESYSSRGPTNDFRPKPDLVTPVNVTTGTSPYTTFPGTSAAAPHAAAAAALLRSQTPGLGGSGLRLALLSHTVPMGSVYEYGNGRLRLQAPATANQPPTASFSASPSSGAPGTLFTFDASSSTDPDGNLVGYQWSFGDGTSGSGPMVSHSYASPGTYTVQLTVTDNEGATDTATRSVSVQSAARPDLVVSGMTASPTSPVIGQSITFSITVQNQGSASAGSFRVRLIGASSSTYGYLSQLAVGASQLLTLTLPLSTSSETFTATADDLNQVLESNETNNTRSLTVTAGITPVVARAGGPYAGTAGSSLAFNGTASTGPIATYQWSFGDGATAYGATPSHTYAAPGTYSVTLTVFGSGGQQSSETTQAVISTATPALTAQLSLPKSTYQVGEAIVLNYTLNRPAYVYICDVTPDGRVTLLFPNWREPSASVGAGTRTFPGTTTYTVQITEPTGTETLYLFAATGPIAGFPATFSATFPLLSTNPSGFRNAVLANMQSQYSSGDRAFDTLSFTIVPATPTTGSIRVSSNPSGAQVRIDGAMVGTTTHEQQNVSPGLHTVEVSKSGYQTVTQQVNVLAGQTAQVSVTLPAIPSNQPPNASFSFTPAGPTAGDTVSFDASASSDPDGTIVSYAWEFGDGSTGSGQFVTHAFTSSGSYSVKLTVTDNQGSSRSVTKTVSVMSSADVGWVSPVAHTGTGTTWTPSLVDRAYDYDVDRNFRSSARHDPLSRDQWTANLILHAPAGGVQSDRVRFLVADSSVGGNELAWVVDVERDGAWVNAYTGTAGSLPEHDSSAEEVEWVEIGFDQGLVTRIRMRAYLARDMVARARVFEVMIRDATVAP